MLGLVHWQIGQTIARSLSWTLRWCLLQAIQGDLRFPLERFAARHLLTFDQFLKPVRLVLRRVYDAHGPSGPVNLDNVGHGVLVIQNVRPNQNWY